MREGGRVSARGAWDGNAGRHTRRITESGCATRFILWWCHVRVRTFHGRLRRRLYERRRIVLVTTGAKECLVRLLLALVSDRLHLRLQGRRQCDRQIHAGPVRGALVLGRLHTPLHGRRRSGRRPFLGSHQEVLFGAARL